MSTKTQDGFENLISNLGTEQDKRSHSRFVNGRLLSHDGNRDELSAMYRTDWLAGKAVDIVPDDMVREWREFDGDIDPKIIARLVDEENRLAIRDTFNEAHKWARLYGTAFIIMVVSDGLDPREPLDISKTKEGDLQHIKAIDRHFLYPAELVPIQNPFDPMYGYPEFYRFVETSVVIHHSRVLRFDGVKIPYAELRRNNYNSDSILARIYDALTNFVTVANGAASMVYETNVDVVQIKGLMGFLQTAEGEAVIRKRFALAGMLKSNNNMLLLDAEESFNTKNNTFSGLPDLLSKYANFLAAATDIPATRLLGSAASGFNATGEGDLKNYYDNVRSSQIRDYKPKLDIFDKLMARNIGLPEDADLSYDFKSLYQMSEKEVAEVGNMNAQRDAVYLDREIVTEVSIAKELKQKGVYTNITDDEIDDLDNVEEEL